MNIGHSKIQHNNKIEKRKEYFWIWAQTDERRIVWGAYSSYAEAQRIAASKLNTPFEIVSLPTRDESAASRMLRARLLNDAESSQDVDASFKRFSHKQGEPEGL